MLYRLKVNSLLFAFGLASRFLGVNFPPAPTAAAIIYKKGRILVTNLSYRKGYALPGGFLKGKEDFIKALKREIKEETNLSVTSCSFFNTYTSISSVGKFPKVTVVYLVKVKGILEPSVEGFPEWVNARSLVSKLVYKDNRDALKDFLKRKYVKK